MRSHYLIAGACAAALFGAATGATITTNPIDRGIDAWDHVSGLEIDPTGEELGESAALPDHYPLITPEGRFEVGELRDRGLYRNRRFAMYSSGNDYPHWENFAEPAYDVAGADTRYLPPETGEPVALRTASDARASTHGAPDGQPVVLAAASDEPLTPPPLAVAPRVIDVAAELAARD